MSDYYAVVKKHCVKDVIRANFRYVEMYRWLVFRTTWHIITVTELIIRKKVMLERPLFLLLHSK